jgi:hypothetical protein
MNMALEGASRDEIDDRIKSELGDFDGLGELLDDVFTRAGRA